MQIIKEKLEIDEELEKKINNLFKFNNIKVKLKTGSNISITNTNITYIEPHKLIIKETTYLFFNKREDVYINDLSRTIPLKDFKA